jgi:hypothetical protein
VGQMIEHEYDPDDVFYGVEAAAEAAAEEVLDEDAALRAAGFDNVGAQHDQYGEIKEKFDA